VDVAGTLRDGWPIVCKDRKKPPQVKFVDGDEAKVSSSFGMVMAVFMHSKGAVNRVPWPMSGVVQCAVKMPKKRERVFRALPRHFYAPLNKRYGRAPVGAFRSAVVQPDSSD